MARKVSVLIVDASSIQRERISNQLREIGCRVTTTSTGVEAVSALMNEEWFDAVLSDLRLKEESGIDLYVAMRKAGFRVPFVLYSDHAIAMPKDDFLELGITDVLQKPFYKDEIENCVARIVSAENLRVAQSC